MGQSVIHPFWTFLKTGPVLVATALLVVQAGTFYKFAQNERPAVTLPLQLIPSTLGEWVATEDVQMDDYAREILSPDDALMRTYYDSRQTPASLFVAYFKTQRTDHAPHSPRNCLPGHGWTPSRLGTVIVPLPGQPAGIQVNQYVVAKESAKSVVLYWYQTADQVVANEYVAKLYLMADAMRYGRSDTALVRIIISVGQADEKSAEQRAIAFAQRIYPALTAHFPPL